MYKNRFILLLLLAAGIMACSPVIPFTSPTSHIPPSVVPSATQAEAAPPAEAENDQAVLLFTIGMHIEPMGETAQGYQSGKGDYHQPQFFQRHVQDILTVTQIVEAHGGRMTIQAQSPFTTVAIESGNTLLADLAARGHEIALHFHEDAHLGKNPETLSVQQWCDVMKQEMAFITQASGVTDIRYWSGGNLYPNIYTPNGVNFNFSFWLNSGISGLQVFNRSEAYYDKNRIHA